MMHVGLVSVDKPGSTILTRGSEAYTSWACHDSVYPIPLFLPLSLPLSLCLTDSLSHPCTLCEITLFDNHTIFHSLSSWDVNGRSLVDIISTSADEISIPNIMSRRDGRKVTTLLLLNILIEWTLINGIIDLLSLPGTCMWSYVYFIVTSWLKIYLNISTACFLPT